LASVLSIRIDIGMPGDKLLDTERVQLQEAL
jgi:hypothetical protein